ncbi:MAG: site-specific DNA-methyltransferase [Candidatus Omnitrophica bacterium]|nr:site-specific DNA-methyltransferase [Candidatus Omnitrophota bacterium]
MLEIKRVLKKTGTLWLNMGDTYSDKCLLMIPERFALMMVDLGFILRNKICWYKSNHLPSSVRDRFTNSWEYVYFFTKSKQYYFDLDAVGEKQLVAWERAKYGKHSTNVKSESSDFKLTSASSKKGNINQYLVEHGLHPNPLGKNPGDIWLSPKYTGTKGHTNRQGLNRPLDLVTIKAYKEYQKIIAEFLKKHIKKEHKPILDSTFGKHKWPHWLRTDFSGASLPGVEDWFKLKEILNLKETPFDDKIYEIRKLNIPIFQSGRVSDFWEISTQPFKEAHFATFPEKLCEKPILAGCPKNGIVLDPFCGSGTALVVAKKLGRNYIGIDIKEEYCEMSRHRLASIPEKLKNFITINF